MIRSLLGSLILSLSLSSYSLDDFDLASYGPEAKIEDIRTGFIVKIITYSSRKELSESYEETTGIKLKGRGIRAFSLSSPIEDVCYVHIIPAKIWDDREAMAIMGHEIYHCALADHVDFFREEK